jgi:hypothetical protein
MSKTVKIIYEHLETIKQFKTRKEFIKWGLENLVRCFILQLF